MKIVQFNFAYTEFCDLRIFNWVSCWNYATYENNLGANKTTI